MSSAIFVQLATKHGSLPREHLTATAVKVEAAEGLRQPSKKVPKIRSQGRPLPPEKHRLINPVISIGWCIYIYIIYITPLISGWNDPSQIIYFRPFIGGSISSISFTSQAPPTQPGCPPLRGYFWHALQRLWRKIRLPWSIDVSGSVNRW